MPIVEVTDSEMELLRVAVEVCTTKARDYAGNTPNEEDEIAENAALVEWVALQEKFPPLGGIHLVNQGEVTHETSLIKRQSPDDPYRGHCSCGWIGTAFGHGFGRGDPRNKQYRDQALEDMEQHRENPHK